MVPHRLQGNVVPDNVVVRKGIEVDVDIVVVERIVEIPVPLFLDPVYPESTPLSGPVAVAGNDVEGKDVAPGVVLPVGPVNDAVQVIVRDIVPCNHIVPGQIEIRRPERYARIVGGDRVAFYAAETAVLNTDGVTVLRRVPPSVLMIRMSDDIVFDLAMIVSIAAEPVFPAGYVYAVGIVLQGIPGDPDPPTFQFRPGPLQADAVLTIIQYPAVPDDDIRAVDYPYSVAIGPVKGYPLDDYVPLLLHMKQGAPRTTLNDPSPGHP